MQDRCSVLSRLNKISGYDIRLVSVSPSYVKLDQRVSLDPSCTVQKLVESKFLWIKLDANDFTVGYGVCVNNEPQSMTWIRAGVIMNTEIYRLWSDTTLSADEEVQKARLDFILESMGKWIPP